jgi:hypothetical protein
MPIWYFALAREWRRRRLCWLVHNSSSSSIVDCGLTPSVIPVGMASSEVSEVRRDRRPQRLPVAAPSAIIATPASFELLRGAPVRPLGTSLRTGARGFAFRKVLSLFSRKRPEVSPWRLDVRFRRVVRARNKLVRAQVLNWQGHRDLTEQQRLYVMPQDENESLRIGAAA